jgi:hypothetical protein
MRQAIQWLYAAGKAAGIDYEPPILTTRYELPLLEWSKHETESAKTGWVYCAAQADRRPDGCARDARVGLDM